MTIKEAVQMYDNINGRTADIRRLLSRLKASSLTVSPNGYYEIGKNDLVALNAYLLEYEEMLKHQLDEAFEK